jgi:NACHT domain- and WD repeat-containing protein
LKPKDPTRRAHYDVSVTEREVIDGLLTAPNPALTACYFRRVLADIRAHVGHRAAPRYIDFEGGGVDEDAQRHLARLRDVVAPAVLPPELKFQYELSFSADHGGVTVASHEGYLKTFSDDFCGIVANSIRAAAAAAPRLLDPLLADIAAHTRLAKKKAAEFVGRSDLIARAVAYAAQDEGEGRPFVIIGGGGGGKSSLMCAIATKVATTLTDRTFVIRFVGTTPASSSGGGLLRSMSAQIVGAMGSNEEVPSGFDALADFFPSLLSRCGEKTRVVVLVDAVDQLDNSDNGKLIEWLPRTLPEKVRVIVSCLPNKEGTAAKLTEMAGDVLEIAPLSFQDGEEILHAWLSEAKRRVTDPQRAAVMASFEKCPTPLFLRLAFEQARSWHSYDPIVELPTSHDSLVSNLMREMELRHGAALVSRAVCAVAMARDGLSVSELEDVISLDDNVLKDVFEWWYV